MAAGPAPVPSLPKASALRAGQSSQAPTRFLPLVTWADGSQSLSTCNEGLAFLQASRSSERLLFIGAPRNHAVPKSELLLQAGSAPFNHTLWIWPKAEPLPGTGHDKVIMLYLPAHPDMAGVTRRLVACALPITTVTVLYGMEGMERPTSMERLAMATSALVELQVPQQLMKLVALVQPPPPPPSVESSGSQPQPVDKPTSGAAGTAQSTTGAGGATALGWVSVSGAGAGAGAPGAGAGGAALPGYHSPGSGPRTSSTSSTASGGGVGGGTSAGGSSGAAGTAAAAADYGKLLATFLVKQRLIIPEILLHDLVCRADFHLSFQADPSCPNTAAGGPGAPAAAPAVPPPAPAGMAGGGANAFAAAAVAVLAVVAASAPPTGSKHLSYLLSKEALDILTPPPPPQALAPSLPQARLVWRPEPAPLAPKPPPLTGGNWLACMLRAYVHRHQAGIACTLDKCRAAAESFKAYDAIDDALDEYRTRMAPAAINVDSVTAMHPEAQAAACKEFLNMVLDVRDTAAVTDCYRTLKSKCEEEFKALVEAISNRGPLRLQKGRSSVWGGERFSETGGTTMGPRSLPTLVQRVTAEVREARESSSGSAGPPQEDAGGGSAASAASGGGAGAGGVTGPASAHPSASPFYDAAQSDLHTETSTSSLGGGGGAGGVFGGRKPSLSLSGALSTSTLPTRPGPPSARGAGPDRLMSYGLDPGPSPTGAGGPMGKLPQVTMSRRTSTSGALEQAPSKDAGLLDREHLNGGTLSILQKQFGSQSTSYLRNGPRPRGPRMSASGTLNGKYVGIYNSGSSSDKLHCMDGQDGPSPSAANVLPAVRRRVSESGKGSIATGGTVFGSSGLGFGAGASQLGGLPKVPERTPMTSPPRSPQGAHHPPLPAMEHSFGSVSAPDTEAAAPQPSPRVRGWGEPKGRPKELDGPPGLYATVELDNKLQNIVSRWDLHTKEPPTPMPSVLYKFFS